MMNRPWIMALMLIHLGATATHAQRLSDRAGMANVSRTQTAIDPRPMLPANPEPVTTADLVVGGIGGALVLGIAGGYAGASVPCDGDWCELGGLILGVALGEAIGLPLGVRAFGGQGSLPLQVLASAAVVLAGGLAAPVTGGLGLLAVIPVQLHLVIKDAKPETTRTAAPR